ncbi:MAG: hypothetical protein QGH76_02300 [Phycisphaerales bacterium]|jgi:hypothetical protein|nr:hypothetical protein [Phycisphaerales bacterium]
MTTFLFMTAVVLGALLLAAAVLHLIPRLGSGGRVCSDWLSRAPGLDVLVTYFTAAPLIVGPIVAGWIGLAAAVCGQVLAVVIWTTLHGLAHPAARKGPRVLKVLNEVVGPLHHYAAVWVTALVVPVFWIVRMAEIIIYPLLVLFVRFPRYRQDEWVRVSRHKFKNLVGHDLIWCLYCDWMTGVWSLGSEMLRNVESFWCPIRFDNEKKCENCHHDFPDVFNGWVASDGSMSDVDSVLRKHYGESTINSWYGHPARLTVDGKPAEEVAD